MKTLKIMVVLFWVAAMSSCASVSHVDTSPQQIEQLGHGYTRRGSLIYFNGKQIDREGRHDIDRFARAMGYPLKLCHDVDAESFIAMSMEYTKDKNRVYYKWISPGRFWVVELPDADPETFQVLDFNLAKDATHVWRHDLPIKDAVPDAVKIIEPEWPVWTDGHRVYYQSTVISDADPATFRHLDQGFYRDAKHVYWCSRLLGEADPDTFRTFGDVPYAADKGRVWSGERLLDQVDAASFVLLQNHVYKDSNTVFVGTDAKPVLGADPSSFRKVADLDEGGRALFKDIACHYVYDSSYNEIYTLEQKDDMILISKPAWLGHPGKVPVHGATVSAELRGNEMSKPRLIMKVDSRQTSPPKWEKEKIKHMKAVFIEARTFIERQ